jgi:hypothetical protein
VLYGQTARDRAVELTAVAQESPPKITLQWNQTSFTITGQKVYRRLKDATAWTQIATPANGAIAYEDTNVAAGISYEYYVARTFSNGPTVAQGYAMSGIRLPVVSSRGRVILLVDDTMAPALATEMVRLVSDLTGDGWSVVRRDISRTATPAAVRAIIQTIYNASPSNTVALMLFGHIPVPYSGDDAIDGHSDHVGAWPSDVFYGDLTGAWTDSQVDDSGASDPRNRNVPGDGKFDPTFLPSDVELQVGRIDFANMPSFGVSEAELLRRYLDRDHAYRHKLGAFANVGRRGLVDDQFGFFGGEAFAVTAWRSFTACVGAGNVDELDWFSTLQSQSYLWAYGCGGGNYQGAIGIGSTSDFINYDSRAVFTILFGSYFGDWDTSDAFLRAPLAGTPGSLGLISCWAGRPHWFFHPMALGETAGYCARLTQNNTGEAQRGYDSNYGPRGNHVALLGDPTLRLYPMAPATDLVANISGNAVTLNWTASVEASILGYLVERSTSATGPFVQLSGGLIGDTSYVDSTGAAGTSYTYRVRAVKMETSPTGSYFNSSQGVFVNVGAPADIAIYPPAINRSIHAGNSVTETLSVANSGGGTLAYTVSSSLARYNHRDSDSFGGPTYGWTDISATGTRITGWQNTDDAISNPISLGFTFPFFGNNFTTARVCSNGYISFTDTSTNAENGALPNTKAAANIVAALWTDLVIFDTSRIYWKATSGKFVVQFEHMALFSDLTADLTFQIILQSNGEIVLQYKTLTGMTSGYTVGVQNGNRDTGLLVTQGLAYVHPGMAIRIRPPGLETWLSLTPSSSSVSPGGAQQMDVTLNASGLTAGNYYAEAVIDSNAPGKESAVVPVRLTVGNTPIENWRLLYFGSASGGSFGADTANPDGDAHNNLLEYAFSRNPGVPDTVAVVSTAPNSSGYLEVRFERDATRSDLRYIVEATSDLLTAWTPIANSVHGAPMVAVGAHSSAELGSGNLKSVVVEDVAPCASFTRRYLRVRIVRD